MTATQEDPWDQRVIPVCRWASCGCRMAAGTLVITFLVFSLVSCSKSRTYPEAPRVGREIAIDVTGLSPDVPVFFTYRYKGISVNYFIINTDNRVIAFLDACAKCYPQKMGYRFSQGYFVCRACNVKYSVADLEKGIGGCFPIRLEGSRRSEKFYISASDLEAAADKF